MYNDETIERGIKRIKKEVEQHKRALHFAKKAPADDIANLLIKIEEKNVVVRELEAVRRDDATRQRIIYCKFCKYCKEHPTTKGYFLCQRIINAGATQSRAYTNITDFCSKGERL